MAEAQDSTERRVKWLRRSARILALIWASLASPIPVILSILLVPYLIRELQPEHFVDVTLWVVVASLLVLFPWVSTAIAWRWETIGAAMLATGFFIITGIGVVATGALTLLVLRMAQEVSPMGETNIALLVFVPLTIAAFVSTISMALPPLALAILFGVTSLLSKTATQSRNSSCQSV